MSEGGSRDSTGLIFSSFSSQEHAWSGSGWHIGLAEALRLVREVIMTQDGREEPYLLLATHVKDGTMTGGRKQIPESTLISAMIGMLSSAQGAQLARPLGQRERAGRQVP